MQQAPFYTARSGGPHTFYTFFWKGRVALYAILKALVVGPGDSVLMPGYTCVVVPAAARFLGARCLYVDIDPGTYNVSVGGIQRAWGANAGKRIKAVIVQHTYGLPADTASIAAWAQPKGIAVIEDCCHVLGSRYRDLTGAWRDTGTLGDAAFFSSQWSKPISTGLGGWTATANPSIARAISRIRHDDCVEPSWREAALLRAQVLARSLFSSPREYWAALKLYRALSRAGICIGSSLEEELLGEKPLGYAKRMCQFQERLLARQLAASAGIVLHRKRLQRIYQAALARAGLPVLHIPDYADPVLLRFPVRVTNKRALLENARRNRVELGDWFDHPLHPKESDAQAFGYETGMCPEAEKAAGEVVNLPVHARITEEEAVRIVGFVANAGQFGYSRSGIRAEATLGEPLAELR